MVAQITFQLKQRQLGKNYTKLNIKQTKQILYLSIYQLCTHFIKYTHTLTSFEEKKNQFCYTYKNFTIYLLSNSINVCVYTWNDFFFKKSAMQYFSFYLSIFFIVFSNSVYHLYTYIYSIYVFMYTLNIFFGMSKVLVLCLYKWLKKSKQNDDSLFSVVWFIQWLLTQTHINITESCSVFIRFNFLSVFIWCATIFLSVDAIKKYMHTHPYIRTPIENVFLQ